MEISMAGSREDAPAWARRDVDADDIAAASPMTRTTVFAQTGSHSVYSDADEHSGNDGGGGSAHGVPIRGDRDEDQVAALIAHVDPSRLRGATLLGRCFEVLVPAGRLCAAFARTAIEAPWSDRSPLAEALRAHTDFADADRVLQAAVARVPLGGAPAPPFVACCGCSRPWCAGRPCAIGWMRPVDPIACRRLLAWQWAEHGVSGLNADAAFGGFYARELIQCVEPDAGHRLASCRRRRDPAGDHSAKRHCRRAPTANAVAAATDIEPGADAAGGLVRDDGHQHRDVIGRTVTLPHGVGSVHDRGNSDVRDERTRGPLLLSCGPRCVITIRDTAVYASALGAACRRDLDDMPHPSQPALRGRVALGTSAVERWVRVAGDAFIVRVHLPSTEAAPWDAHG